MSCPRRGYDPRSKGADRTRPRPRLVALELFDAGCCCCCCWLAAAGLGWEAGGGACLETSTVMEEGGMQRRGLLCLALLRGGNQQWGEGRTGTIQGTGRCNLEKDDVVSATWIRSPLKRSRQNPSTTASCCPRVVRRWLLRGGESGAGPERLRLDHAAASRSQTTSSVADGGDGEQGATSSRRSLWSVEPARCQAAYKAQRSQPAGRKAWGLPVHVAEVPVSLSFSTGRADVLRMGWRRGQRAHLCPCMHRAATDSKLPLRRTPPRRGRGCGT